MTNEVITVIANVALTLSFVVAVIFGIAQVRSAERDRQERLALEWLRNFQSREFAELMHYILSHDMPKKVEELRTIPEKEQIIFIQLSQQMESLGLLVATNLITIDLVEKTLGSFVVTAWEKYKTLFSSIRKDDPYTGEYFEWLAQRINERLKNNPRKPFNENPEKA